MGEYIQRFSSFWEDLCKALHPQGPPKMMKKDCFTTTLKTSLRLRVDLKKLQSYEDAIDVAKKKEWKLFKMSQLGMVDSLPMEMEIRKPKCIVQRAPIEVLQPVVLPMVPQIVPAIATIVANVDDGLRQEMKQVVGLIKNLSHNLLICVGNGCRGGTKSNQSTNGAQNDRS